MFRYLALQFPPPGPGIPGQPQVFLVHPIQLNRWLEAAWASAPNTPAIGGGGAGAPQLGSPTVVTDLDLPPGLLATLPHGIDLAGPGNYTPPGVVGPLFWEHLGYSYVIESTGAYEILTEILRRLVVGETLGELSAASVQWARTTEDLFFRDPPLFSIGSVVSQLRPSARIARRNAYWRMFGLDLPHPVPSAWAPPSGGAEAPWKFDVGNGVNTGFRERWSELLRQVWLGLENSRNQVGANATDREYVALLCQALDDMLGMRRRGGQLAREEFAYVTTMSWFHLTVEYDTPIVVDLKATATSPAERLAKLGERVGMAPAARARELFELAEPLSALLWAIELGSFNTGATAEALFLPPGGPGTPPSILNQEMNRIIDLWQSATGERVKERPVEIVPSMAGATARSAQPLRAPTPGPTSVPLPSMAGNGRRA
jgi:hypothetical protein